jgi:hypothetical protein
MKQAYIITYELHNPGQNYEELLRRIKSYGTWARLGGSEYIIISTQTAVQIRDYLVGALDYNDSLFVGTLIAPAAWRGMSEQVSNWILNNLK